RVAVKSGELVQFYDILGGSSRASQNEHSARFGLGPYTGAEWVVVLWPNGQYDVWRNVEGNQQHTLAP
ncbi:MAG: ASPIC/UnbV domain-containing protein, partial [Deltaproteobacteria bacterium]